jgi:hypothetical protein
MSLNRPIYVAGGLGYPVALVARPKPQLQTAATVTAPATCVSTAESIIRGRRRFAALRQNAVRN